MSYTIEQKPQVQKLVHSGDYPGILNLYTWKTFAEAVDY